MFCFVFDRMFYIPVTHIFKILVFVGVCPISVLHMIRSYFTYRLYFLRTFHVFFFFFFFKLVLLSSDRVKPIKVFSLPQPFVCPFRSFPPTFESQSDGFFSWSPNRIPGSAWLWVFSPRISSLPFVALFRFPVLSFFFFFFSFSRDLT